MRGNVTRRLFARGRQFLAPLLLLAASARLAADELIPEPMMSLAKKIEAVFTSDIVRIILVCCLCGSAIAYAFNKDSEKIKRNAIAIGIAAGVLVGASGLVTVIMGK